MIGYAPERAAIRAGCTERTEPLTTASPRLTRALHPSEVAKLRADSARAWARAALVAAPIVAVLTLPMYSAYRAIAADAPIGRAAQAISAASGTKPIAPLGPVPADPAPAIASPAQGTTGTAELPPEPVDVPAPTTVDTSIVPAARFLSGGASAQDRGRALQCLTAAIYYEAASEPDDGQRAVAQVVLNRVRHPAFPATVCGVVYQGSERTSGCQFSFACDGSMARIPSRTAWTRALRNAAAALAGQVFAPVGLATHYHTYAVTPAWNRTLVMTDAIGAHFFHRWKGYWGTAPAFSESYRGGEPFPGPHPRALPLPGPVLASAISQAIPQSITPAQFVQPTHVESGTALGDAAPDNLPKSSILERWKDSGKPLR